jgi:hypothetical protein
MTSSQLLFFGWLLRSACETYIVEYLAGGRPLTAYQYHPVTHSDAVASRLRASSDFITVLRKWIGWDVDRLNESPFTTAIFGDNLDFVTVFKKQPQVLSAQLCDSSLSNPQIPTLAFEWSSNLQDTMPSCLYRSRM